MADRRPGLLGLVAIAACGQPAPPVLAGRAPPGDPPPPAPAVTWTDHAITVTGLPAIAQDGSAVVIAHRDGDGGRGNPNLTLIEKDRSDRERSRFVVITSDEVDRLDPHAIARRFAAARSWLDDHHAALALTAMTPLATRFPSDEAPAVATGAGIAIRWVPSELVIERQAGAPIVRTTPPTWLAADYPMCQTCSEVCHNDAYLGGGYADVAHTAAVVVVSYRGTDTCWEPGSQEHVVVW
ncbi:MAG TPA: hypothetical protein VFK02_21635 [Kofleriaceae bacterium]|nr:hypothetical protein [Kofleriaceae bacterium]